MSIFPIVVDWWRSYGGRAIELQRFAKMIVSLCASSSGCERNWSAFEFVCNFFVFISARESNCSNLFIHSISLFAICRSIPRKGIGYNTES
jgi:hypothetical protein